jgi:hypothetical protein
MQHTSIGAQDDDGRQMDGIFRELKLAERGNTLSKTTAY